jgi:hypothetical protein
MYLKHSSKSLYMEELVTICGRVRLPELKLRTKCKGFHVLIYRIYAKTFTFFDFDR